MSAPPTTTRAKATKKFQPQFDVLADGWRQPGSAFKPFNYVTGINDRHDHRRHHVHGRDHQLRRSGRLHPDQRRQPGARPAAAAQRAPVLAQHPGRQGARVSTGIEHVFDDGPAARPALPGRRAAGRPVAWPWAREEVHPVDLVDGYATLANGGRYIGHTTILRSRTRPARTSSRRTSRRPATKVVSPQAAYIVTDILAGNTDPRINPVWGKFNVRNERGPAPPGDAQDRHQQRRQGPHRLRLHRAAVRGRVASSGEYALAVGAWNGNSDDTVVSTPGNPVFSIDVAAPMLARLHAGGVA